MSLTSALNSAMTGLDVSSRRAQVVSENVANVGRDGFARRELDVSPISAQLTGVRTSVQRIEDGPNIALRREAAGQAASNRDPAAFWAALEGAVGVPGELGSLGERLSTLEARLIDASTRPGATDALDAVSRALSGVADGINSVSDQVQRKRQAAETGIVQTVADLNTNLAAIEDLNLRIQRQGASGADTARLLDQRAIALDRVSQAVAIQVLPRDFGTIAIISQSGQILLDGKAAEITFAPAVQVTPDRTVGAGLNGLEINGRPVPPSGSRSLSGGRLEGLFATRDIDAPEAQARLDAMASEVVARFSGPTADPTLAVGEMGLFVDAGTGPGAADRLAVNPLVDLGGAGQTWRIRDGLNAVAPDPSTPTGNLDLALNVVNRNASPLDPILGGAPRSIPSLAADLTSAISSRNGIYSDQVTRAQALIDAADEGLADSAVSIDEEMRRLIEIEQNYAAAARVVQVVGDMMDRLSRI